MRMILKKQKYAFILSLFLILIVSIIALAHNPIPYSIDWTNTNLITTDNIWSVSGELGVRGYSGADTPVAPRAEARIALAESLILDVKKLFENSFLSREAEARK
ncbi:hypothetical protein BH24ACI1_BH24ACI1_17240 [soil metagenome]